jgi:G:T-mismatch repair DNA endonuclease (very short patch repair protein)
MKCKICGLRVKNLLGLSTHIRFIHKNIDVKKYYDKYLNLKKEGNCLTCGKKTKFINMGLGYCTFCSNKCIMLNKNIIIKIQNTKKQRYGSKGFNNRIKSQNTTLDRYGVSNVSQLEEVKNKKAQTCIKHFGVKSMLMCKEGQDKYKKTMIEKYGVDHNFKVKEIRDKRDDTLEKRYGERHISKTQYFKDKYRNTCMEKYGIENTLFLTDSYSKISQKLFWNIYNKLNRKEHIHFSELNKEFHKRCKNTNYFYDFVDNKNKKVIEFNGDIWHGNVKLLGEKYINPITKKNIKEMKKHDKKKNDFIKRLGYELLIVWEDDYYKNPQYIEKKCLNFLKNIKGGV